MADLRVRRAPRTQGRQLARPRCVSRGRAKQTDLQDQTG